MSVEAVMFLFAAAFNVACLVYIVSVDVRVSRNRIRKQGVNV